MLSSTPFGNLRLNRSPSSAHMEFTVVATAVSAVLAVSFTASATGAAGWFINQ